MNGGVVIINVNPVANLLAGAIEFRLDVAQNVGDLAWDEFLDVLIRAVIVGAVRNRRLDAKTADPGAHQHVAGSFGAGVRTRWIIRRGFSEAVRVVQFQITKYFIGRDMVQALAVLSHRLENGVSADDIGLDKRPRVTQGIIIVTFGGKMHHDVGLGDQAIHQRRVANITFHKRDLIRHRLQISLVTGVGQIVNHRYVIFGLILDGIMHKVRANEPCTSRNEHLCHSPSISGIIEELQRGET